MLLIPHSFRIHVAKFVDSVENILAFCVPIPHGMLRLCDMVADKFFFMPCTNGVTNQTGIRYILSHIVM